MNVPLLDPRKVLSPNVRVQQMTRDLVWLFNDSSFNVCWRSLFRLVDHMVADVEMCHYHLKKKELPLNSFSICHWPPCCVIYSGGAASVYILFFHVFTRIFPFQCHRDTVAFVWLARFIRTGLWLAAEKLSRFDSSQVCSEMPFFKRQKAREAFASDSRVP